MQRSIHVNSTQPTTINQAQAAKPIKELTLLFPVSSGTKHRTKTNAELSGLHSSFIVAENNQMTVQVYKTDTPEAKKETEPEPESAVKFNFYFKGLIIDGLNQFLFIRK